jgi:hypothetical protein
MLVDASVCQILSSSCDIRERCIVQSVVVSHTLNNDTIHIVVGVYFQFGASFHGCFLPMLGGAMNRSRANSPNASVTIMGDWNVNWRLSEDTYTRKRTLKQYMAANHF